jgi:hypothetical protein
MQSISRTRFIVIVGAGLLFGGCADPATDPVGLSDSQALSAAVTQQDAMVNWHAQQAGLGRSGPVAGASASVVRNANGVSFRLSTTGSCPATRIRCGWSWSTTRTACANTPVLRGRPLRERRRSMRRCASRPATSRVARVAARSPAQCRKVRWTGWLADRSFDDSMEAEIHLVVNDHGPMLPAHMPGMIHTYRGGCADSSPFPASSRPRRSPTASPVPTRAGCIRWPSSRRREDERRIRS